MGEAVAPRGEYIILLLPYEKDEYITRLLDNLQKKHFNVEYEYHNIKTNAKSKANQPGPAKDQVSDESWRKATILVTFSTLPPDLKTCHNLKLVHLLSAGANQIVETPLWESDIPLTNSSGIHSPQIAEWVVMQVLSHSHKEKLMLEWQKRHFWGKHDAIGAVRDSVGQRLGVLGYGAIGRQAAKVCQAMSMDVIAYTAGPRNTPASKKDHGYIVPGTGDPDGLIPSAWYSGLDTASLHNFLAQDIDILLVSVPLTPQTQHFLGADEFRILSRRTAFVANIARGKIIQQDDLIESLRKGELRGVALDVTDPEPLPKESPLWDMENVSITPHASGLGTMYIERSVEILDVNLGNMEEGRGLINLVDRRKGY